jgi:hypothetical protein
MWKNKKKDRHWKISHMLVFVSFSYNINWSCCFVLFVVDGNKKMKKSNKQMNVKEFNEIIDW